MAESRGVVSVVILAAGEGKRFRSAKPKVLHEMCGLPMLGHVVRASEGLKPAKIAVVIGRGAEAVDRFLKDFARKPVVTALQPEQLGTADATRIGEEALGKGTGTVLVMPGDTPLLSVETLRKLVSYHRKRRAAATVLTAQLANPKGYGRIVRDSVGGVQKIVEETDATLIEKRIAEVNTAVWVFDRALLRSAISPIERQNAQRELYLTDIVEVLVMKGETVEAYQAEDAAEISGVNSRSQLAAAASVMRDRIAERHMAAGVTIVDPSQTYIDATVRIGRDTTIHPLTFLSGQTVIGNDCEVGPSTRVVSSKIADGARVQFSVLDHAVVGAGANVGPYAYLRPGATLGEGAKAGTFVEIKKSRVGKGSKVPHLSYIGDAEIGTGVNVGAGTITCNYDGENKHKTIIENDAFIGSDTMLIAPVRIGTGAFTGAGSAIAKDVPPGALGVERSEQNNIKGWASNKRKKGKRGGGTSK
ncbi:MAG: bifunctional UDP-N-acetylglucosamine diphosphorylase/glucosamine-1-phosphate N-acetyltransferase GlmU [Actinomycetota bacterium]|nr:bifunctional UDP-N-acetylglucosamine diphosphorylase/glucosamine-1-phosphate N-acetyltransferase GlmU [Actinomycetota bacterium]